MMTTTNIIGSILIDMGFISMSAAGVINRWYVQPEMNKLNLSFWQQMMFIDDMIYWNEFPDFKHRLLLILVYVLPPLGFVLMVIGGGWLGGTPMVLLQILDKYTRRY